LLGAFSCGPQSYFWLLVATDAFCPSKEWEQVMQAMFIRCLPVAEELSLSHCWK